MLGNILGTLIHERRISKTAFSNYLDVSRSTLDDYINEKTFMTSDKIEKTAAYFKVPVGYLFGETNEKGEYLNISLRQQLSDLSKQIKGLDKSLKK